MTTSQLIASAITWAAAIAAVVAAALSWRAQQQARDFLVAVRAERRTFTTPGGGEVTVTAPMSDADYQEFRAAWLAKYDPPSLACTACRKGARCVEHCTCRECVSLRRPREEQPDA